MTKKYAIEDKAGEFVTIGRFDSGLYDTRREAELALLRYVDAVRERETSDYGVVEVEEKEDACKSCNKPESLCSCYHEEDEEEQDTPSLEDRGLQLGSYGS